MVMEVEGDDSPHVLRKGLRRVRLSHAGRCRGGEGGPHPAQPRRRQMDPPLLAGPRPGGRAQLTRQAAHSAGPDGEAWCAFLARGRLGRGPRHRGIAPWRGRRALRPQFGHRPRGGGFPRRPPLDTRPHPALPLAQRRLHLFGRQLQQRRRQGCASLPPGP